MKLAVVAIVAGVVVAFSAGFITHAVIGTPPKVETLLKLSTNQKDRDKNKDAEKDKDKSKNDAITHGTVDNSKVEPGAVDGGKMQTPPDPTIGPKKK